MEIATCPATKTTTTATGDVEVRCTKPAGHAESGDPRHEARLGVFPVRWQGPRSGG
ncbi:hypothetical protein ABT297_36250 [Dactylosporangium sp. NPDC000555]|uniref:hypothetical protein n=1 Tax=Dactylosporangium sp. NPDC000555 TaxID=3154260 RepID=UPI00331C8EB4